MTLISPNSTQPRRLTCVPFPTARPRAGNPGGTGTIPGAARRYRHTPTRAHRGADASPWRAGAWAGPKVPGAAPRNPPLAQGPGAILAGPWHGYAQGCRSITARGRVIALTSQESASAGLPTAAPASGGPGAGPASSAAPVHGGAPVAAGAPAAAGTPGAGQGASRSRGLPGEPRLALGWALLAAVAG